VTRNLLFSRPRRSASPPPAVTSHDGPSRVTRREMSDLLNSLRTALPNDGGQVNIGVISAFPGEGVSTVAQSIARAAADTPREHVLLCAMQAPTSGNVERPPFLFMETFADEHEPQLSYGEVQADALAHAADGQAGEGRAIMRALTRSFTTVVVDLPPTSVTSVGPMVSRILDGVILVIEAERARAHALRSARKNIEKYGGRILGVVLNKRRYHIPEQIYRLL